MRNILFILVLVILMFGCVDENKKDSNDNDTLIPVILNTNAFDNWCPGWRTNGYIETNGCLLKTNRVIKVFVSETN